MKEQLPCQWAPSRPTAREPLGDGTIEHEHEHEQEQQMNEKLPCQWAPSSRSQTLTTAQADLFLLLLSIAVLVLVIEADSAIRSVMGRSSTRKRYS